MRDIQEEIFGVLVPGHVRGYIFFFKQKTAYEISLGLVGSEMCIRDSTGAAVAAAIGSGADRTISSTRPSRQQPETRRTRKAAWDVLRVPRALSTMAIAYPYLWADYAPGPGNSEGDPRFTGIEPIHHDGA